MIPFCDDPPHHPEGCNGNMSPWCLGCTNVGKLIAEMRRYLYRNVAAEYRKTSDLDRHMPDVRGWT